MSTFGLIAIVQLGRGGTTFPLLGTNAPLGRGHYSVVHASVVHAQVMYPLRVRARHPVGRAIGPVQAAGLDPADLQLSVPRPAPHAQPSGKPFACACGSPGLRSSSMATRLLALSSAAPREAGCGCYESRSGSFGGVVLSVAGAVNGAKRTLAPVW